MATQFDPIAKDESLNTTEATPRNIADVLAEGLKGIEDALPTYTEGDGIDISAQKVISVDTTFSEAVTRANIASGDPLSTIWGKIKKFFTDLKAVAFSGAAADVTYGAGTVEDALDDLYGGGAVDVLIAPTGSTTQEITVDLSLYSLLICSKCNSTGKIVYAQSVIPPKQISSGMLTNVNLYESSNEVDFTFTSSGGARINGITANTYGALYGVRK